MCALLSVVALGAAVAACGDGDGGGGGGDGAPANRPIEGAPGVAVVGDNLSFDPDELTAAAGDFNVTLTSEDQFHDFAIEDVDGL
ncbi:MAG: hypothetical protein L0221_14135, partial [Chloroflexi bacterium]|nr:hypothetical protein [Chloroflexota bacterium]